jgi:DNA helicase-2/ATP-dependent DNA helicase PcrA
MFGMSKSSFKLTPEQDKAVKHVEGPLLVVAGAGTGKTRVITERIKYLIEEQGVKPQEILALTFTEKAAGEMLTRIGDIMPLGYEEPYVYTFHSFADRILKQEGLEIGLDTSYKILSTSNQWILFRKSLFKFDISYFRPLGNPTKFISAILKFVSRLQDENISPEKFSEFISKKSGDDLNETLRWKELASIYKGYQDLKLSQSKLDFGDLIFWLLKLFKERPNILSKYQTQFKHILVDEFQDTNYAQYELIRMLYPAAEINSGRSLVVVGDDSQSIYKFRGAAVSNILEFKDEYKAAEMITLIKNYRSNQSILDASYKLVQNNNPDTLEHKLGISKKLISEADEKKVEPEIILADILETEVDFIIAKIYEILGKEPEYTYKDFAILARANSHLDPFILALKKYELPYQLVGNRGLYDQDEVRNILALLKVVIDPADNLSLYRGLNVEVFDISHDKIVTVLNSAKFTKTPFWETLTRSKDEKILNFINSPYGESFITLKTQGGKQDKAKQNWNGLC